MKHKREEQHEQRKKMANSSSSDSELDENYSEETDAGDVSLDTSVEEGNDQDNNRFCLYGNEPEYDTDELADLYEATTQTSENEDTDEEDEMNSSRLENVHWCGCSNCCIMPTLPESKCCKEFRELLGDKLENKTPSCITNNPQFRDMCLKEHVLEGAHLQNRRYHGKFTDIKNLSNRLVTNFPSLAGASPPL